MASCQRPVKLSTSGAKRNLRKERYTAPYLILDARDEKVREDGVIVHRAVLIAIGIIEAVGEGVTHLKPGDRAAYASNPPGSYSEVRVMPATCVVRLPDAIDFETAAAMMLKGLTAQYLLKRTRPVEGLQSGDFLLFHAAAGGVGLTACQWARALGLQLIGTAGSEEKCAFATRERTQAMADELFEVVQSGAVKIHIAQRFALRDVAEAHRALESRQTVGSTILTL
jgi:NADPH:quinone reductase-like Zn-dependent oxidoreductase